MRAAAALLAATACADRVLRPRYDSTFDFDDSVPTGDEPNFFAVFGEAFKRNARFSEVKPVPMLGDESTPDEEVESFYKFWCGARPARSRGPSPAHTMANAGTLSGVGVTSQARESTTRRRLTRGRSAAG